jgi:sugar O-acyltransferase (sialic acid O-acetyltransferase NeuD family)
MEYIFFGAKNPETGRIIAARQRVEQNFHVRGFLDNDSERHGTFIGYPVFGDLGAITDEMVRECLFVNLITGNMRARFEVSRALVNRGCRFGNLIHPSVDLTMASVGVGNYIQENVVIQAGARIGNNSSLHMAALIAHEVIVGNSVFVAHAVSTSGEVVIEDGAFIGTNATIIPRIRIGKWATVGAGSVVVHDVPPYATVVGNPAKVINIKEMDLDSGNP